MTSGLLLGASLAVLTALEPLAMLPVPPTPPPRTFSVTVAAGLQRQPSTEMDSVYGTSFPIEVEVRGAAWWGERVGVGVVAGVQHRTGEGIGPKTAPVTILWQIPVAVEGHLRLAIYDQQPVVPTLRVGLGAVGAIERWEIEGGDSGVWRGVKASVHVAGGVQIRLPFPELSFGRPSFGGPVAQDLYLHVEGRLRSAANFGLAGLDLSGAGLVVGLTLLL